MMLPNIDIYAANTIPREEFAVSGHRACQGCAEVLAVRLILKGFGKNTIMVMATGCMEIISTPLPTTELAASLDPRCL